jgi:hypothetical protein
VSPKKKRQPWMAYPTSSECAAAPTIRLDNEKKRNGIRIRICGAETAIAGGEKRLKKF